MSCLRFSSGTTPRLLLMFVAAVYLIVPVIGQTSANGRVYKIPGESVSPQLEGKVLQVLFDGLADMYYLSDSKASYYYITDRNGRLFTLSVPQNEGKDEAMSAQQRVKSVLKVMMHDVPALHDRIESCKLEKHELTGLMHDYQIAVTGSDEGIEYELPPPAFIPHIGFFAGYNVDLLKAGSTDDLNGFMLDPALYPSAGISFRAFLPRLSNNLSINLDLSVGKRYIYGYYSSAAIAPPFAEIFQELHMYNYLLLADFMIGNSFGQGHLKPFASGGIRTCTIIADNSRIETDMCNDATIISDTYEYSPEEKTSLGLKVSFGLSFEISRLVCLTTSVNYSELFVSPAYGSYRSAGVTIGANF